MHNNRNIQSALFFFHSYSDGILALKIIIHENCFRSNFVNINDLLNIHEFQSVSYGIDMTGVRAPQSQTESTTSLVRLMALLTFTLILNTKIYCLLCSSFTKLAYLPISVSQPQCPKQHILRSTVK